MALPKITTPTYEVKLPSSGKTIKYRPFLVKEEKILLIAKESGNNEDIIRATRQIIENCTFGSIDTESDLSTIDLETLFLKLVIVSKGETSTIGLKCQNHISKPERTHPIHGKIPAYNGACNHVNKIEIDLTTVQVVSEKKVTDKIILDEASMIGIKMKYPDLSSVGKMGNKKTDDDYMNFIYDHVDYIFDSENIHEMDETPREELVEFFENLDDKQFKKILEFFQHLPTLGVTVGVMCEKCGDKTEKVIKGLNNFFM